MGPWNNLKGRKNTCLTLMPPKSVVNSQDQKLSQSDDDVRIISWQRNMFLSAHISHWIEHSFDQFAFCFVFSRTKTSKLFDSKFFRILCWKCITWVCCVLKDHNSWDLLLTSPSSLVSPSWARWPYPHLGMLTRFPFEERCGSPGRLVDIHLGSLCFGCTYWSLLHQQHRPVTPIPWPLSQPQYPRLPSNVSYNIIYK